MLTLRLQHIPNLISVARIFLVIPVMQTLLARDFRQALIWFILAGLSDGVDGFLARTFGWQSRLGSYLDPIADKLLLVSSYLALAWLGLIPAWLAWLVLARDLMIFLGATAYYFLMKPFDGQPSLISKLNTFCQLLFVALILLHPSLVTIPEVALQAMLWTVTLTTALSGLLYVGSWGRLYHREHKSRN
jgi:cardiolipin synthase